MEKTRFNHVREFRQRYGLSQRDLAFLINRSQGVVSSTEYGESVLQLDAALALQVLFRQAPKDLFPGCFEKVEERVMRQAAQLIEQIEDESDRKSRAKLEFLENLARGDNDIEL